MKESEYPNSLILKISKSKKAGNKFPARKNVVLIA